MVATTNPCQTREIPPRERGDLWVVSHECTCEHGRVREIEVRVDPALWRGSRDGFTNAELHRRVTALARCEDDHPEEIERKEAV
jgi:hypothetical protein